MKQAHVAGWNYSPPSPRRRTVGRRNSHEETHVRLDGVADTSAMASTYKLSSMMAYCKVHLHHVKDIINNGDSNFKAVPLAGDIGGSEVLPALSTFLSVIVMLYTLWTCVDGLPAYLSFCCDEALSIRCSIDMPMLMDIGPGMIDLAEGQICCPNYDVGQIPMILKEPTDARSLST